jgi:uncharacterized protein YoxC
MAEGLKSGNGSATSMGEPEQTRKIPIHIQWKLNLAELIMQVDELPEDACKLLIKSYYTKMHEGAAAEAYQQINVEEAINQYGGDEREAFKRYLKCWHLLNMPLEGGNLGLVPPDAPAIVKRVWKNLETLLLHPVEDEVRISREVAKRTEAFEAAAREYNIRLSGALKALEILQGPKKELGAKLKDAYENVQRAAKDLEDAAKQYQAERTARETAEKRNETYEKQVEGLRAESERLMAAERKKLEAANKDIESKKALINDLSSDVEITRASNEELAKRVEFLEADLKKRETELTEATIASAAERKKTEELVEKVRFLEGETTSVKGELERETSDRQTYQEQSGKFKKAYDDKERELIQEREKLKAERSRADEAKGKADRLEKKLNNINLKWGVRAGIGAVLLAAGVYFFRPPAQVAPVENVPQEVINYSKDRITVKFGSAMYEMSADKFSNIYEEIQKDQQKSGRQFTPADRKQYFEEKVEGAKQIK